MSSSRDRSSSTVGNLIELLDDGVDAAQHVFQTSVSDVWRDVLLPEWLTTRTESVTRKRIIHGVPPDVQGELWFIGLALPAGYDDSVYETSLERAAELRVRISADMHGLGAGQFRQSHSRLCSDLLTISADVPRTLSDQDCATSGVSRKDLMVLLSSVRPTTSISLTLWQPPTQEALDPLVIDLIGTDLSLQATLRRQVTRPLLPTPCTPLVSQSHVAVQLRQSLHLSEELHAIAHPATPATPDGTEVVEGEEGDPLPLPVGYVQGDLGSAWV